MSATSTVLRGHARGWRKLFRYTMVSVVSVGVSQTVLFLAIRALGWEERAANVLAVAVGTVPSYYLNRAWAWGKSGRSHFLKEVAPFWALSFLGLVFSTATVGFAAGRLSSTASSSVRAAVAAAANLGAFGVLWVAKFAIFNKLLFASHPEDLPPALDGRTGVPS